MVNTPLISIIIPIHNLENHIAKTLDSVCNQTYENLQIILVNDGSKDGSLNVCHAYAQKDKRIMLINKNNAGIALARQSGLNVAVGDYIHYLDGGDFIDISTYRLLVEELNNRDFPDVLLFGFYFSTATDKIKSEAYQQNINSSMETLKLILGGKKYNAVWQYIHRKELANEINFDARLTIGEDAYYTSQLLYFARSIAFLDKYLLYYVTDDGPSVTRDNYSEKSIASLFLFPELIEQFMSNKPEYEDFRQEYSALHLQAYKTLILNGHLEEMNRMVKYLIPAFKKYPELKSMDGVRRVHRLVVLYNFNKLAYKLLLMRYKRKGRIKY